MELRNRQAFHEFYIDETYTAGMVLTGTEIKSLRLGRVSFNDSFCYFTEGGLWVKNLHIAEYAFGTHANHDPLRLRKLLLNRQELRKLESSVQEDGLTLVPLRLFFSEKGWAKLEIGLARGKKLYDKRETLKKRESERALRRRFKT